MKNKKQDDDIEIIIEADSEESDTITDEEPISSCETRRKIEDLHERRRYQDELGDFDEIFDLPIAEKV